MNSGARACIAYIVARAISDSKASHAYDYSESKYVAFTGDVTTREVNVYDYGRRCYCSGSLPQLYDYGNRKHIDLQVNGDRFSGFDYDSRKHFEGSVSGNSVSLYDYETSKYYNYTV
ncbi:hypothetical protein [Cupriavidus sp. MP-37]|uniref:hypothetical protein n=1 Tax=Cupriavidus sp. MP-37 TaxID=2884455 RepID=UPI001D0A9DD0|nr:hypothetical protein [Cupriavidus sp. MP-37]UDM52016.1 hypothetical protein LIN44_22520 [Cupriavidus sp. MP-37]